MGTCGGCTGVRGEGWVGKEGILYLYLIAY